MVQLILGVVGVAAAVAFGVVAVAALVDLLKLPPLHTQ